MTLPGGTELGERVGSALVRMVDGQRRRLTAMSPALTDVADALATFVLDSGKRLRSAFAYWGCLGAGGTDSEQLIAAVAALEWLHAGALIHDDVMDGSDTRRGAPSVHRRFAALHAQHGWHNDADSFGRSAAILLGDLCLIWSDEALAGCGLPTTALQAARPVYDEMRTEVMAGQYLDLLGQSTGAQTVEQALLVARFKTAKYTVERPLHLGAALAGGGPDVTAAYTTYGLPLGEAFQLRDDVLGVFGDPARTGKPAGDDLREGKWTVLIAQTLTRASAEQTATVQRLLGDPRLTGDGVDDLRAVIEKTGALDHVEGLIAERTERALAALQVAPVTEPARSVLRELATAATVRAV